METPIHAKFRRRTATAIAAALMAVVATALPVQPVYAQAQAHVTIASNAYGSVRKLEVELNKSMIVDLPAGVAEVVVSQPSIAAAIMRTRTRAIVQGMAEGETNILFMDDHGRTMSVLDLRIVQPPLAVGQALEDTLRRVIPNSNIRVETLSNSTLNDKLYFLLTGTVQTAEDKAVAESLASQLSESDEPTGSLIQVIGGQQVMLQVTVSEIRRDVAKQLGINLSGTATIGNTTLGFNNSPASAGTFSGTAGFPLGNFQINASLQALENRGAARMLAQPTLTAMSGSQADFLVGGEVQYVTGVDPTTGLPIFTFREYGIGLNFTPTVKSNGSIGLTLETEVSEPITNATLATRRASTTVELPPGTTLAIGGLLSESANRAIDQLPGLGSIPILGALFRSNEYRSQQTELVILVTPYIVAPSPANAIAVPTDSVAIANDAEAFFLGAIEKQYGVGATGEFRGGFSGSVGFVLD